MARLNGVGGLPISDGADAGQGFVYPVTHKLLEWMTGHPTRLAQEHPDRWHEDEDEEMDGYFAASADLDRAAARLPALAPRGWLIRVQRRLPVFCLTLICVTLSSAFTLSAAWVPF